MYTINFYRRNRTEYYPTATLWGANLIAINAMRQDEEIEEACIVDNETGVVEKIYKRD